MRRYVVTAGLLALIVASAERAASDGVPSLGFAERTNLPAEGRPIAGAIADVTGDGTPDVVLAPNRAATLVIHPGDGQGGFGPTFSVVTGAEQFATRVRTAVLDGDATPDVVVNHHGTTVIDVVLFDDDGNARATSYAAADGRTYEGEFHELALWNGDAHLDIVTASSDGRVRVRLNDGSGVFGASQTLSLPGMTAAMVLTDAVARDLDSDGRPDLVVLTTGGLRTFLQRSDGSFSARQSLALAGGSTRYVPSALAVADFDGDGLDDVASLSGMTNPGSGVVSVFLRSSATTFEPAVGHSVTSGQWDLAAVDLNGDGRAEIVTPTDVLVNDGSGAFGPAQPLGAAGWGVAVGDVLGDARPDVLVIDFFSGGTLLESVDGAVPPTIAQVAPSRLWLGTTNDVTITGTGFRAGATVDLGPGITGTTTVDSATTLTVAVTVEESASAGARSIVVRNPDGGAATAEIDVVGGGAATVTSLTPSALRPGASATVEIAGAGFVVGASLDLGAGVTVTSTSFIDASSLSAQVAVELNATPGGRTLTLVNGTGLSTVLQDAFVVLPAETLFLLAERGQLSPGRSFGRDRLIVSGTLRFTGGSVLGTFDPTRETAVLRVGDPAQPTVLTIPPDAGWRVRGSRATWKSPRGTDPGVQLVLDSASHTFRVEMKRASVAAAEDGGVLVELTLGDDVGSSTRIWTRNGKGTLRLR